MRKKPKVRGESCMLRTKQNEPQYIMDWINNQSNFSKSIRHLIEKDVAENGVRDLKEEIMYKQIHPSTSHSTVVSSSYNVSEVKQSEDTTQRENVNVSNIQNHVVETEQASVQEQNGDGEVAATVELLESAEADVIDNDNKKVDNSNDSLEFESDRKDEDKPKKVKRNMDLNKW